MPAVRELLTAWHSHDVGDIRGHMIFHMSSHAANIFIAQTLHKQLI